MKYFQENVIVKPYGFAEVKEQDRPLLVQMLIKMNVARNHCRLYPEGHQKIDGSIADAYSLLIRFLGDDPRLLIAVFNKNLVVGNRPMKKGHHAVKEIALSLDNHGIHAVVFKRDITLKGFFSFVNQLAGRGVFNQFNETMPGIEIQSINYDNYLIAKKKKIRRRPSVKDKHSDKQALDSFLTGLSSQKNIPDRGFSFADPEALAVLLNRSELELKPVARIFGAMAAPKPLSGGIKESGEDLEAVLSQDDLNGFLDRLNPSLRRQFLSLTFNDYFNKGQDRNRPEKILKEMDGNRIMETLLRANSEKQEISPHMLTIINRIVGIFDHDSDALAKISTKYEEPDAGFLQDLFAREEYERYVEDDYSRLLQSISQQPGPAGAIPEGFNLGRHINALGNENLEIQMVDMYLSLLKTDLTFEEYKDFSKFLTGTLRLQFNRGRYGLLLRSLGTFLHHRRGSDKKRSILAAQCLKRFNNPYVIIKVLKALGNDGPKAPKKLKRFLLALGPEIIPEILYWCGEKRDLRSQKNLLQLLTAFEKLLVGAIERHYHNPDTLFVKNMIILLETIGTDPAKHLLRKFYHHSHIEIKLQSLAALVTLGDGRALEILYRNFTAKDKALSHGSITIAGQIPVTGAVHVMVSGIKRSLYLSKAVLDKNIQFINSLGNIGDPSALPVLKKITVQSWSFSPKRLLDEKIAVYTSLKGYDPNLRAELADNGLLSGNSDIRNICELLIQPDGKADGNNG